MAKDKEAEGGTVLRGADGSLYFVRDDMLDILRIRGEGLKRMQGVLADTGKQADAEPEPGQAGVEQLHYVSGDLLLQDEPDDMTVSAVRSTIMCPWFCGHSDEVVAPG